MRITPPDIAWTANDGLTYKPSWKRESEFISPEHAAIWDKTQHLPGWQDVEDSQKLYEMAWYNGQVFLEIGVFGGRSAAVEILGALAADFDVPPQYYGVDIDPGFLSRSQPSVEFARASEHCLFYHGNLNQFVADLPIVPTMVFVDGDHEYDGCLADLRKLTTFLAPGTPVLCHGYHAIEGVRRAVDEMVSTSFFVSMGQFAGSILLQATYACPGRPRSLQWQTFQLTRSNLLARYQTALAPGTNAGHHTNVADLVHAARLELMSGTRGVSGRGAWPLSSPHAIQLPATLPHGKPWPRISIITPSFNQGKFIEQTLLSVANQGYPNVEHIVIDGGSTDETVALLQKHAAHLAFWVSEKDRGQSDAINKGFARATGEIITWLNSDDMLAPGALGAMALAFDESGADMVAGIAQLHRDGEVYAQHLTSCADGPLPLDELADLENRWLEGQFFYQPEVFFKRQLLLKVGGGLNEEMFWSLDYELWFRFAQANAKLKVIGRPIAMFRVHDEQKTNDAEGFKKELRQLVPRLTPGKPLPPLAATPPRRRLRIAMLNDVGFRYGAGIAHQRITQALVLGGHEVIPLAVATHNLNEEQKQRPFEEHILPRLKDIKPDVVVVGNLHAAGLGADLLAAVSETFPTVFVSHDLWLLTGRCAYFGGCEKHLSGCDTSCPTASSYPPLHPSKIQPAWQQKMNLLTAKNPLVIASNSLWTNAQYLRTASHLNASPQAPISRPVPIRYGVPLDIFQPRDSAMCRELFGLPKDAFILLFSCSSLADSRKGFKHLLEAIKQLAIPDLVPVAVGNPDGLAKAEIPGLICVGYITDPHQQALLYSAADLFVAPSLEEAFGQVFIEAAACGTPSVAYPLGGVTDAVRDGVSGRLAGEVSPNALAAAIEELYWNPRHRHDLGVWGRIWVENEYSIARSLHSFTFALRQALELTGSTLAHKVNILGSMVPLENPAILFEELGFTERSEPMSAEGSLSLGGMHHINGQRVEKAICEYYHRQLKRYRDRYGVLCVLHPKAWLARINRKSLLKVLRKDQPKTRSKTIDT